MIVVDTTVIAYLVLPGDRTAAVERVRRADPVWSAPPLWRSELRNVLATYMRLQGLAEHHAVELMRQAERLMQGRTLAVRSAEVLRLAATSGRSAYDCEFVALAQDLAVPLVTADRALLQAFPALARSPETFAPAGPP